MKPDSPSLDPLGPEEWEALARYVAGESDPSEAADIEHWLAADPRREAWLRPLDASLDRLVTGRASAIGVETALARVLERTAEPEAIPFRRSPARAREERGWGVVLQIAAALLLLVGGGWLLVRAMESGPMMGPVASVETLSTEIGERGSFTLDDGTEVVLGPLSRLEILEGYGDDLRAVRLEGEGVFEVVHDERQPFVVHAGGTVIRDLGTVFVVREAGAGEITVAVSEGEVEVASRTDTDRPVRLDPGDRVVLGGGQTTLERGVSVESDMAWSEGRLVFQDEPMSRVATDLARWYGIEVRFAEASLAQRRLTATFAGESAEQVTRAIGLALDVRAELEGATLTLDAPVP